MERNEIEQLVAHGIFPYDQQAKTRLIETAISYILLKGSYAYKIKKNIKLSFLDFSTLEKRRHFCYEELRLNQRLAKDMYINVFAVSKKGKQWSISKGPAKAKEYVILMKGMNPDHQLNALLKKNRITKKPIRQLAQQLADFHQNEKSLSLTYDPFFLSREFADIEKFSSTIEKKLGVDYYKLVQTCIQLSNHFVLLQQEFISKRPSLGYFKNCHGDLHSQNIFIEKKPVIFDCIEFREAFRHIDVLNEIAFLCMDLETYGYADLSKIFLTDYIKKTGYAFGKKEQLLFTYFKAYRACIRAKVHTIEMSQHSSSTQIKEKVKKYIEGMAGYMIEIAGKF
jgi:aminoglycoside phosphotransferase family enzyme